MDKRWETTADEEPIPAARATKLALVWVDAQSTNGTWLDGRQVEHAPVGVGQVMRSGECVGVFALRDANSTDFGEHAPALFGGPEMAELLEPVKRAAVTTVPVLLIGDTGTGKERLARALEASRFSTVTVSPRSTRCLTSARPMYPVPR